MEVRQKFIVYKHNAANHNTKMTPPELKTIVAFLKSENIKLSARNRDGRINSSVNETQVLSILSRKFKIEIPRSRGWFDFATQEGKFYPVNIKITDTTHADNLNCKLGLSYALTGIMPSFPNEIGWNEYFEFLKKDLNKNDKDYYFLVINKKKQQRHILKFSEITCGFATERQ